MNNDEIKLVSDRFKEIQTQLENEPSLQSEYENLLKIKDILYKSQYEQDLSKLVIVGSMQIHKKKVKELIKLVNKVNIPDFDIESLNDMDHELNPLPMYKGDFIPMTNKRMPREKNENETFEDYETYLVNYYKDIIAIPIVKFYPNTIVQIIRDPYPHERAYPGDGDYILDVETKGMRNEYYLQMRKHFMEKLVLEQKRLEKEKKERKQLNKILKTKPSNNRGVKVIATEPYLGDTLEIMNNLNGGRNKVTKIEDATPSLVVNAKKALTPEELDNLFEEIENTKIKVVHSETASKELIEEATKQNNKTLVTNVEMASEVLVINAKKSLEDLELEFDEIEKTGTKVTNVEEAPNELIVSAKNEESYKATFGIKKEKVIKKATIKNDENNKFYEIYDITNNGKRLNKDLIVNIMISNLDKMHTNPNLKPILGNCNKVLGKLINAHYIDGVWTLEDGAKLVKQDYIQEKWDALTDLNFEEYNNEDLENTLTNLKLDDIDNGQEKNRSLSLSNGHNILEDPKEVYKREGLFL